MVKYKLYFFPGLAKFGVPVFHELAFLGFATKHKCKININFKISSCVTLTNLTVNLLLLGCHKKEKKK